MKKYIITAFFIFCVSVIWCSSAENHVEEQKIAVYTDFKNAEQTQRPFVSAPIEIEKQLYGVWQAKEYPGYRRSARYQWDGLWGDIIIFGENTFIYDNSSYTYPVFACYESSAEDLETDEYLELEWLDERYTGLNGLVIAVLNSETIRVNNQNIMQKYKVYQMDNSVIVENMKDPKLFKYEEWIKINERTECEIQRIAPEVYEAVHDDEAVLQWYQEADFDNDNRMDIVVYNQWGMGNGGFTEIYFYQQLPDGMYRRTHQINSSGRATRFLQYDGITYFMVLSALDYNASENEYDYRYCELYYFQDGYPQETVRFTPESTQVDMAVKKRFVNDFINISEGNR